MASIFKTKKPTSLDRKLRKLQDEMDEVNHDIRVLTRFVDKPSRSDELSKLKSVPRPNEVPPQVSGGIRSDVPWKRPLPPSASAMQARQEQGTIAQQPALDQSSFRPAAAAGRSQVRRDERFADYLSAGSFEGARPLRQENRILRNKAIAAAIVVIILLIMALGLVL